MSLFCIVILFIVGFSNTSIACTLLLIFYIALFFKKSLKYLKIIHRTNLSINFFLALAALTKSVYYSKGTFTGEHRCVDNDFMCVILMESMK